MASFPLRDATRHPKPIAGKDLCDEENPWGSAYVPRISIELMKIINKKYRPVICILFQKIESNQIYWNNVIVGNHTRLNWVN